MKDKNKALDDYKEIIHQSWTYRKLTTEEKERLETTLNHESIKECLKGDYYQRIDILRTIYTAFLNGVGYDGFNWREKECDNIEEREIPLF